MKSLLLFDCLIQVLRIYSSGLSLIDNIKSKMTKDTVDTELYTQKAEELGVSLDYYLMEFV
jgi:hypothetical protein